jgi:DNA replicative helicase MCM subunit Mcm2 (Cdc46/Mcm family)
MGPTENDELLNYFEAFYRNYYRNEIDELARQYPDEERSLFIEWEDLHQFDSALAEDYRSQPDQLQKHAETALQLDDLPGGAELERAHVRIRGLDETTEIREIRAPHRGKLISIQGILQEATDVRPKITEAAFQCQRCGTLTRVPQSEEALVKPTRCQGCERNGPFEISHDQSEFVDAQTVHLLDDPANIPEGTVPGNIDVHLEDDLAGEVAAGDKVRMNGVLQFDQKDSNGQDSTNFAHYMDGISTESRDHERAGERQIQPTSATDLDTYIDLAATALSTLPEDAREEETKAKLITPFVEALGWNKFDSKEVRLEYTDSKTTLRPDYALFGPESEMPDVIVEAKQLSAILDEKEQQIYDYLRMFSTTWGILTNGRNFYVYHQNNDTNLPEKLAEMGIEDLPQASIVDSLRRSAFYG